MDEMRMESVDIFQKNIEKLESLFPDCITEGIGKDGKLKKSVNFDRLKLLFSNTFSDKSETNEVYEFTWVGKKAAVAQAYQPIRKTLRPCPEESKDWDTTENVYIEGDNLDVLKLLQESYLGKIKMIYIDPPYNTGNDFVYDDDYSEEFEEYMDNSGQYDEVGNRLIKNMDSNGRFHTDWLNMLYPRIKIARNLLKDSGVMFISIDDHEQENLKKICDEIFGAKNFVAQLVWERAYSPKNDAKYISNSHDYILTYAKNIETFQIGRLPRTEEANARYKNPDNDSRGIWKPSDMSVKTYNAECDYPITTPSGRVIEPPTGRCWRLSKKAFLERLQDNRIYFGEDGNSVPCIKRFLSELKFDGMAPTSILFYQDVGHSQEGAKEVTKLLEAGVFDGPKPVRLISRLITLANLEENDIVLDFFSGSSSTAHGVLQENLITGRQNKYIMVQIAQETAPNSEAYKAGYHNICEIGKERIRRAGKKILEENPDTKDLDIGFRVLKLDSTNMKEVYYTPSETQQTLFDLYTDNIKPDRTPEDLLFQVMLDLGVLLSSKIEEIEIAGKKVFNVADGFLIACFDDRITDEVVKAVAQRKPYYAVFRDSCMADDSVATNFEQIFVTYSPETIRKVL